MIETVDIGRYDEQALKCPNCGSEFMHRMSTTQYEKEAEANPSDRRTGIKMGFDCEQCVADLELVISQHKGREYTYWQT